MIKSEVVINARVDAGYPKLMINTDGDVVLFKEVEKGTIVFVGKSLNYLAYFSSMWNMDYFTDFVGKLTLSNGSE